jgi:hypothetical protein
MNVRCLSLAGLVAALAVPGFGSDEPARGFRETVGPLLERRCLSCHNPTDRKGGLSLASADETIAGGASGPAIAPGEPEASYLLDLVTPRDGKAEMPKDGAPLRAEEVAAIRNWIAGGAKWPDGVTLSAGRVADADWWSLRPISKPPVPAVAPAHAAWARNPIDAFIVARLEAEKLSPSAEADRRTLIRRLSFDLLGLPPSPEEVDAFIADSDPLAYERLVDRLLADPRYGERWARHWLDVAHYGDTHGYDKDQPRPNAWPYRDYVIRSFNDDKPYARFLREQIAGDVLFPGKPQAVVATGFLAAGPWDLISHVEVPETKIDGQIARSLDRDDFVRTVMETFASTTVGCARCHNHMFDPITQEDYYSLQAVFAAIDRADRPFDADPETHRRRAVLLAERRAAEAVRASADVAYRELEKADLAAFRQAMAALVAERPPRPEFGYHGAIEPKADATKWVQVDLGRSVPIAEIVLAGCYDEFVGIGAGFGFPVRFRVEASDDAEFRSGVATVADRTAGDVPNPGVVPQRFSAGGVTARYVRVTATKLAPRQNDFIFALAELRVLGPDGINMAAGGAVTSLDSVEAVPRWRRENLTDGVSFGSDADEEYRSRVTAAHAGRDEALARLAASEPARLLAAAETRLAEIARAVAALPTPQMVYAAATEFAPAGNFLPTHGRPREIHLLRRGGVRSPGEIVGPGTLRSIATLPGRFELPSGHAEGDRRAALADWLAHRDNPLTWRSIANRLWGWHFGRAIADSPNDLGRMGQPPTHPKLLDWLAAEFRDSGGSTKHLHRLIVTSATYRQSSSISDFGFRIADSGKTNPQSEIPNPQWIDSDNRLLWRMNRRRLEAEEVRDAVLVAAGQLDAKMYGRPFQDFVIDKPEHSPHYLYEKHDPDDAASHRRSVYRFIVRSQPQPFLTTLDCADASMSVDKRNETVTPLQALALLNDPFMVAMSRRFAERVSAESPDAQGRITAAFRLALGREPTTEERDRLTTYAARHGMPNACRLILNLNEFVYVD